MRRNNTLSFLAFFIINSTITMIAFNNCGTYEPQGLLADQGTRQPSSNTSPTPVNPDISSVGTDPLFALQWHLKNTGQTLYSSSPATLGADINVESVWAQGIKGNGIYIQVSDDGVENTHEDLVANMSTLKNSKDYTLPYPYTSFSAPPYSVTINKDGKTYIDYDHHGTSVAGLISATQNNSKGGVGVAPKAILTSSNLLSVRVDQTTTAFALNQLSGSFDISNMSWGLPQNEILPYHTEMHDLARNEVLTGRSGKGKIYVKSAGNDFVTACNGTTNDRYCIGNANFDQENSVPYFIVVGALNADNIGSSYGSTGSNIWISSYGGEYGTTDPAMLTTDRSGCTYGSSRSNITSPALDNSFQRGSSPNQNCNYTVSFNGTSSAAPLVSGVVALMLEANPRLNWRDVRYILAKTAVKIDSSLPANMTHPFANSTSVSKAVLPSGMIWDYGWTTNQANFQFSNFYGFGSVDAAAAVAMAKTYTSYHPSMSEFTTSASPNLAITDNSNTPKTSDILVPQSNTVEIEYVQVKLNINHASFAELKIELIHKSTDGTKTTRNIISNPLNALEQINISGDTIYFTTNAFYKESSAGTWTLSVSDAKSGNTGTLVQWGLRFGGTSAN